MVDIAHRSPNSSPGIAIGPITDRAKGDYVQPNVMGEDAPAEQRAFSSAKAMQQFEASLPASTGELGSMRPFLTSLAAGRPMGVDMDVGKVRGELAKSAEIANAYSAEWREHARWYQTTSPDAGGGRRNGIDPRELAKSNGDGPLSKAILDIGTSQNFASITGGQSLGYVSLDTRLARGTVRPDSFTLYQALPKSAAYQVVDYWPYIDDTGGALPGSATSGFSNVQSGTLSTNAGIYSLQSINLKLMLDGRAVTLALMAQNSFVSINEQENANAALTVLGTADWLSYWGNPNFYGNQFTGIASSIPTANIFDFQAFYNTNAVLQGWSTSQTLFNMLYECAAVITSWGRFGRITHAFMTPTTAGALSSLVTTLLNNIIQGGRETSLMPGIIVDGDLQGMRTRMGPIQFPLDTLITARDIPAQGQPRSNGTNPATATGPTPPVSVTLAASGTPGASWGQGANTPYVSGATTKYWYAVASADINMNESTLTWSSASVAGTAITSSGAVNVTITGPVAADAVAYRVFRTGSGGLSASPFASGANSPTAVRYVGTVAASGSGAVTFVDTNSNIPGSETIFLLDLRNEDAALDYRFLLPLTRIELFAQNLYMPWAVASIGAVRNRIPKFHGLIRGFVPDNPIWNPLGANV
jgi:hypothetical protein